MTMPPDQNRFDSSAAGRRSGITLIELLVVIVIMAVIMAISIPAFTGMGRGAGMRGAVAEITSTLALSRQWAITKREEVTFTYGKDLTQSYYYVYAMDTDGSVTIIQTTNALTIGCHFDGNPPFTPLTFDTTGGLAGGFNQTNITITGQNLTPREIIVSALTGGISVK